MRTHALISKRHFLPNFLTKKNLSKREETRERIRVVSRHHHASHRVAPRHGQSGPEWGHGVNRRQRRTYRTFSFFILSLVARFSFREDHLIALTTLSRPSKQIGCDVMMFRLFSLSPRALRALLLSHRNHHIVSRSIILSRVIKAFVVAFSFFKRSLTILLLLHRVRAHRRKRLSPWQASSPREWYGNFWSHFLLRARTIMFVYK